MTADPLEMEEFDLDRYLRASERVDLSGVTRERVRSHPLSESEARCLAYGMDIETHTPIYLRDPLATAAAYEPNVTAFLSCSSASCTRSSRTSADTSRPPRAGEAPAGPQRVGSPFDAMGDGASLGDRAPGMWTAVPARRAGPRNGGLGSR